MSETASASFVATPNGGNTFLYTITLVNTGAVAIGSFWFAWDDLPDQNFMSTLPVSITAPSGWISVVTHNGATDGYGIEWVSPSSSTAIGAGQQSNAFTFVSTTTPTEMAGKSQIDPNFDTTSGFVYQSIPKSDPGFILAVAPACFRSGTAIATEDGEVAVEMLRIGDRVRTLHRGLQPIRWIGRRRIDAAAVAARPREAWPVRIAAGAMGRDLPARDLYLSPDHAVFVDDVLVPVRHLANGRSIAQVPVDEVTYYHIELDSHEIVLSEGLATETYLDAGGRSAFEAVGVPGAAQPSGAWAREALARAPLVVTGPVLGSIRDRIEQRAA